MRIRSFRHKGLKRLYEMGSGRGIRADLVAKVEDILHAIEQARRSRWDCFQDGGCILWRAKGVASGAFGLVAIIGSPFALMRKMFLTSILKTITGS